MMQNSTPIEDSIEIVSLQPDEHSPNISKCQIKVCYVSDEPNRNGSVITKETAQNMAASLRGAIICGYYNKETQDFEEHNKQITMRNGEYEVESITFPYGFVDVNAKVWFEKFIDEGNVEREYLMTEGYLWTKEFPEVARAIERGNNQSMELDPKSVKGSWSYDNNHMPKFFIINEAVISRLCILGEEFEPCFESAQVRANFSLDDNFKNTLFALVNEVKQMFKEGGDIMEQDVMQTEAVEETVKTAEAEAPVVEEEFKASEEKPEDKEEENKSEGAEDAGNDDEEEKKKTEHSLESEEPSIEEITSPQQYSLEEIPEYTELKEQFSALTAECNALKEEIKPLREFKAAAEKEQKQAMIDSFYMLSEEDKKDVVANIDSYSVDDIESKLSVICVRNKVSFSLDEEPKEEDVPLAFNLNDNNGFDNVPDWVKAVRETEKNL